MTKDEIVKACEAAGIGARAEEIVNATLPSVQLHTSSVPMPNIPLGASRMGGIPDLPEEFRWPEWHDGPLSFIAQVNLRDIAPYPCCDVLPTAGHLCFFYHSNQSTWGFDPKDQGSWRVVHVPDNAELVRSEVPAGIPEQGRYGPCAVSFSEALTLPPDDSKACSALRLTNEELDAYFNVLDFVLGSDERALSWLLGHPEQIQGEMQTECALVTAGLYTGNRSGWENPRRQELEKDATSWRLLFQVGSEDQAGMMWGDVGCLYFWIHERDLALHEFDKCWMILQCS